MSVTVLGAEGMQRKIRCGPYLSSYSLKKKKRSYSLIRDSDICTNNYNTS